MDQLDLGTLDVVMDQSDLGKFDNGLIDTATNPINDKCHNWRPKS